MSTILDALKKSEQERKLNKLPTLSDMPTPQEKKSWPRIVLLVLILVLATVALLVVLNNNLNTPEVGQVSPSNNDVGKRCGKKC